MKREARRRWFPAGQHTIELCWNRMVEPTIMYHDAAGSRPYGTYDNQYRKWYRDILGHFCFLFGMHMTLSVTLYKTGNFLETTVIILEQ
jgi:hypothetical protein